MHDLGFNKIRAMHTLQGRSQDFGEGGGGGKNNSNARVLCNRSLYNTWFSKLKVCGKIHTLTLLYPGRPTLYQCCQARPWLCHMYVIGILSSLAAEMSHFPVIHYIACLYHILARNSTNRVADDKCLLELTWIDTGIYQAIVNVIVWNCVTL